MGFLLSTCYLPVGDKGDPACFGFARCFAALFGPLWLLFVCQLCKWFCDCARKALILLGFFAIDICRLRRYYSASIGFCGFLWLCECASGVRGVRNWGTDVRAKRICGFAAVLGVNDGFAALVIVGAVALLGIMGNWQFRL